MHEVGYEAKINAKEWGDVRERQGGDGVGDVLDAEVDDDVSNALIVH